MRDYARPPKVVNVAMPDGFSKTFIDDLMQAIDFEEYGFKGTYLRSNILSKYCDPTTTPAAVRKLAAIEKWKQAELRNEKTNIRLFLQDDVDFGWANFASIVRRTRSLISRILGPVRYPEVLMGLRHTNGASTRVRRSETAALHKLMGNAHISSAAIKHWLAAASGTPLSRQTLELVENSVLFTVPKRSDVDRVCCKEPEINMLLQRSVGMTIRQRLRRYGIDLTDQTVNQRLAAGAVANGLATIDLSSASDSITTSLVQLLLPFEWWSLLDDLRVKSTLVDGQEHELNMFSSMGNGFTFELESLLFYALTRAVARTLRIDGRISVYGDDIIAPNSMVPALIQVFHYVGFRINKEKTFWSGTFRESCGRHYDKSLDVSPFFIRERVSTLPHLILILNEVLEWSGRGLGFIEDPKILAFHRRYSQLVPPYLWGGVEPDDNSCLVTGHAPRYRLTTRKKDVRVPQDAGYLHWFMTAENTEQPFSVEPAKQLEYKATRVSRGWLSSWRPWLLQGAVYPGVVSENDRERP